MALAFGARRRGVRYSVKVLLINTLYYPSILGGAERSVQFLAEALAGAGNDSVVVSTRPEPGIHMDWVNGVKVYYLGLRNVYWPFQGRANPGGLKPLWHAIDTFNLFMAHPLINILEDERPDVVHTNNLAGFSVAVWPLVRRYHLPLVHTIRDYYLLCPRSSMFNHGNNCERRCAACRVYAMPRRYLSSQVEAVVGISSFLLGRHLEAGYFPNALVRRVIVNAYEAPKTAGERALVKGARPLRLGYLGRLHPAKGVELLLSAVNEFKDGHVEVWLGGTGNIEYENHLRSRFSSSSIRYLGFVKPEDLLRQVDVLVVPSLWHEPLGRTVFEAYAYGVPVIAARRGGIPEIVEEGKTGFIFDPDRPEYLSRVIELFLENPRLTEQMKPTCLAKARDFEPGKILEQYLDLYNSVVRHDRWTRI
ncbi:MAG: glycosyltransferase [Clostridia bacterium]|nr:MAG: glycosyltransferase [Clostridia bacterium]